MVRERRPLLRGRIDREDVFQAVFGGASTSPPLPDRDPDQHRASLTHQLDQIAAQISGRDPAIRIPGASRELIAVRPESHANLDPAALADRRSDTRLVSVDEDTGVALVDTTDPDLPHLRRKIDWFADDEKVSKKTGMRRSAPAIAPISIIELARFMDLAGDRIRGVSLADNAMRWFEIACRGGYRENRESSEFTRYQVRRALERLRITNMQEYEATERLVIFIRCRVGDLRRLLEMVDCIYEFDLAGPDVRSFLNFEGELREEIHAKKVISPAVDAPAVALLDSGIATQHPLLKDILAGAVSIVPGFAASPEDSDGHGTEMAGIAAYYDINDTLDHEEAVADHWLESARVFIRDGEATATEEYRPFWPQMTIDAVQAVEALGKRPRVFATAISAEQDRPGRPTYWSHAIDRLAYNGGNGRLFFVCVGNADSGNNIVLDGYPTMNLEQRLHDPSQAINAITVGAYTNRTAVPSAPDYKNYEPVAPEAGISPHTSSGLVRDGDAIKPDVVFEGGNVGFDGQLSDPSIPNLVGLTTGHQHLYGKPLSLLWATSEATARAAWFGAQLRRLCPDLSLTTIRGLVVHSATWTEKMVQQFPDLDERLAICGFGIPDLAFATSCARQRATVIVEDEMPNSVRKTVLQENGKPKEKFSRVLKAFRMPLPEDILLAADNAKVELRVTLSYFAEPNTFKRHLQRGLDLRWDIQGLQESEQQFLERINRLARSKEKRADRTKPLPWDLGIRRRSRGTVQSDRWFGPASLLAGTKLIAVYPVLGWWDRRDALKTESMGFSLIVTVRGPEIALYETIAAELQAVIPVET